jgi:hypothetical protein
LPASEIAGWMEYFTIYPFAEDREDFRMARILEMLNNSVQGLGFRGKTWEFFLPDYLGVRDRAAEREQEQIDAEIAFANKYGEALRRAKGA